MFWLWYWIWCKWKLLSLCDSSGFDKNVIILQEDMSSSAHTDSKKKYILIIGNVSTQGLDDTTLTAEKNVQYILLNNRRIFG